MKKSKLGVFGGSFNPIHIGHLLLAEYVWETLSLDKILFIPTYQTPLKDHLDFSPEQRYNMVQLAIQDDERFEISDLEIKRKQISYTIDTLTHLTQMYGPDTRLFLIIGYDNYINFAKWHRAKEILKLADIVVLRRSNSPLPPEDNGLLEEGQFIFLDSPILEIKSTAIRERIKAGKPIKFYVPREVYEYIREIRRIP